MRRALRSTAAVVFAVLVVVGCSLETRDRLKHFFFEVPDESSAVTLTADAAQAKQPALVDPPAAAGVRFASSHPPFMQRKCGECHDATAKMSPRKDVLDACKTCHQRYFSNEVGHSPVTQKQCSQCHDPHRSVEVALLKKPSFDLCMNCHDEPALLSPASHSADDVNNCTACHDPHFGSGKLLKKK